MHICRLLYTSRIPVQALTHRNERTISREKTLLLSVELLIGDLEAPRVLLCVASSMMWPGVEEVKDTSFAELIK